MVPRDNQGVFDPCRPMQLKEDRRQKNSTSFARFFFNTAKIIAKISWIFFFSGTQGCQLFLRSSLILNIPYLGLYLGCKFIQCHNFSFWTKILKEKIASQCNSFKLLLNCLPELPLLLLVIQEMRRDTYISSETAALYFPPVSPSSNLRFWISPSSRRGSVFSFTFRELEFQGT